MKKTYEKPVLARAGLLAKHTAAQLTLVIFPVPNPE